MNWIVMLFGMFMLLSPPISQLSSKTTLVLVVWYSVATILILMGLFYNQLAVLL